MVHPTTFEVRSIVMSVCVRVCVRVSVREHISGTTRAIFTKFLCMLPMAVTRSSSGRVTKSQGEGQFCGFFSTDNALYNKAFGTHIKTAEPIELPFGMMSGHGPRNSVLRGGDDPRKGRGNFGKTCARQA